MAKKRKVKTEAERSSDSGASRQESPARHRSDGLGEFLVNKTNLYLMLALTVGCLLIYGQTIRFGFINIDDSGYIYENTIVQHGLSWEGIKWAFTTFSQANWHPITWLSYLSQVTFLGSKPGTFHLINVLFHAANSVLLYLVLQTLTGSNWRSAIVAALFAFHPAHVESVAWAAERKDVLSTFFWMLTTYCYVRYARLAKDAVPSHGSVRHRRGRYYCFTILAMALGVLAKPMIVTLPFTLLLLDYWPLERFKKFAKVVPLAIEKLPLFALSVASCVVTIVAQKSGGAIVGLESFSFFERLANALVSYARYIVMLFYPVNLGLLYEYQRNIPPWQIASAGSFLAVVSIYSIRKMEERKYFFAGWFWFLGTLIPVIGLLQVGSQAMADRYTYVPFVGLSIALVWLVADLLRDVKKTLPAGATGVVLLLLAGLSIRQVSFWKNSESLYRHTISVAPNNGFIEQNLCLEFVNQGRLDEAEIQCRNAIAHRPSFNNPYKLLGLIFFKRQNYEEAARYSAMAIERKANDFGAYSNLAKALLVQGKLDEAAEMTNKMLSGVALEPVTRETLLQNCTLLGLEYARKNQYEKSVTYFRKALELNESDADLRANLGFMLYKAGGKEEGIRELEESIRQDPNKPERYNMLGVILSDQGKREEAIKQFEKAIELKPDFAEARNNLQKVRK